MKFEHTEVFNFEGAFRGMRNPMNSWDKSDSSWEWVEDPSPINPNDPGMTFIIGENDLKLAQKLIRAGGEHRKFMRQIIVSVDITAPLYWWNEFDTYKVGTVANSTSKMHKLASTSITERCFEMDDYDGSLKVYDREPYNEDTFLYHVWEELGEVCETLRQRYLETKDIRYWKELIRILPESWLQKRTVTMSYENLLNACRQRKNHKLTEWEKSFIDWARTLPYAQELIFIDEVYG